MNYQGSKRRLVKVLVPMLTKLMHDRGINTYYEPFCGGCSIINAMPKEYTRNALDANRWLIALYKGLQCGWVPLDGEYSLEDYVIARDHPDRLPPQEVGYIGFCCSYRAGFFNGFCGTGPAPRSKNGRQSQARNNLIKNFDPLIKYQCGSYLDLKPSVRSVIYCDPPYKGTKGYKCVKKFDHEEFWDWVLDMSMHGHVMVVSERTAPDWAGEPDWRGEFDKGWGGMSNKNIEEHEKIWIIG